MANRQMLHDQQRVRAHGGAGQRLLAVPVQRFDRDVHAGGVQTGGVRESGEPNGLMLSGVSR